MKSKYKRVLLKLSGEALAGSKGTGLQDEMLMEVARQVKALRDLDVEVGIVVGGGNFWRGRSSEGMDRPTADYIGMLATVMNGLALQDAFIRNGLDAQVLTALEMHQVAEPFSQREAIKRLSAGQVVIFSAGTGSPFFSTDTAGALRAAEIGAEVILLAKKVDAVYSADPEKDPNAERYSHLTLQEVLDKRLGVMDASAVTICMDNHIPLHVFGLANPENIIRAVCGEPIGTIVEA